MQASNHDSRHRIPGCAPVDALARPHRGDSSGGRHLPLEVILRHYPFRTAAEIVALTNGWDSGVVFPAGAFVKRVVKGP